MEEIRNEIKSNTEEKKTSYQIISMLKQNHFEKHFTLYDSDIFKTISKAQKLLKQIDTINTRSSLEMERYKNTTIPGFLYQEKYIARFYLFGVMIGYIDLKIQTEKENIDHGKTFLWTNKELYKKEIKSAKEMINKLILIRNNIISDYNLSDYNLVIKEYDPLKDIIDNTLNTCPSYLKFTDLYINSETNSVQFKIHQHLVSAYNIGYINSCNNDDEVITKYQYLLADYKKHHEKNQKKIFQEKAKTKNYTKSNV